MEFYSCSGTKFRRMLGAFSTYSEGSFERNLRSRSYCELSTFEPRFYRSRRSNHANTLSLPHRHVLQLNDSRVSRRLRSSSTFGMEALRLADHFWTRWVREVLPTMQPREPSRGAQGQDLKLGDVVLIVDEALPRGVWPRGRIAKLYPGKDRVTRVVDVATAWGLLRRPFKKLVKLVTSGDRD